MKKNSKRYRIKSKFRFITFIIIVVGLSLGLFGYITGFDISNALTEPVDKTTIEVAAGDTVWDIASEFKSSNKDVREAVYEICDENNIKDGHIEAGMTLSIPQSL